MRFIQASGGSLGKLAADLVVEAIRQNNTITMTTPTGSTPIPLYRALRTRCIRGELSFARATVFMLDEYVDLPGYPARSFSHFLDEHLGPLLSETTLHRLDPVRDGANPARYDAAIDVAGGLDLAIVGVGRNGHVGFNEPGATDDQRTHVVTLAPETLADNFPGEEPTNRPTRAVTIGLRDLRAAREVLMLVSGAAKGQVLARLLEGQRVEGIPATHLLTGNLTVVADESALAAAYTLETPETP